MRTCLVLMAVPWLAAFVIAVLLDPYRDGRVWLEETHTQLQLRPCTFKSVLGLPCPSCGMTSSFALLVRGDVLNSVRANFVGTMIAMFGLMFIPWSIASAIKGRLLFIRDFETVLVRLVVIFLVVLFGRWFVVLIVHWLGGT